MGLIDPEDRREMTHKLVEEMLAKTPSDEFSIVIEAHWEIWKSIDSQIQKTSFRSQVRGKR